LSLASGASQQIDLKTWIQNAGLKALDGQINLSYSFTGTETDLLAEQGSVDQTQNYVFEVPAVGRASSVSKFICYWSIIGDNDSMISLWNYTAKSQNLALTLYFQGGKYVVPVTLGPNASAEIDVLSIIRGGQPDPHGNTIPGNIQEGSAVLSAGGDVTAAMQIASSSAVFNVRNATCGVICTSCNGVTEFVLIPGIFYLPFNSSGQSSGQWTYGDGTLVSNITSGTWSGGDASIATVSSSGMVTSTSTPGSTDISLFINDVPVDAGQICSGEGVPYCPPPYQMGASGPVNVVNVQINSADITKDTISVSLISSDNSLSGQFTLTLTGPNGASATLFNGTQSAGTHSYFFNLTSFPTDEFTQIKASWALNDQTITGSYNYHIRIIGNTHLTVYNTPSESQCSGNPQSDISFDNNCKSYTYNYISGFISRVTNITGGTGSGHSTNHGDVYQEFYCSGYQPTSLRINQTIKGTFGSLNDTTLAACPTSPDYVSGAKIYIQGVGIKTVTDRCPHCCNDLPHFDNYTTSTQCSGIGDPRAL
jgi:hypothetical protein